MIYVYKFQGPVTDFCENGNVPSGDISIVGFENYGGRGGREGNDWSFVTSKQLPTFCFITDFEMSINLLKSSVVAFFKYYKKFRPVYRLHLT
jgi:hypothetical protein